MKLRRLYFYTCLSFCLQGGGVSFSACWDTTPPGAGTGTPRDQAPPRTRHPHPPDQAPPRTRHPPEPGTPLLDQASPWDQAPPPPGSRDGYCCGRYASDWNAFLLCGEFTLIADIIHLKMTLIRKSSFREIEKLMFNHEHTDRTHFLPSNKYLQRSQFSLGLLLLYWLFLAIP